MENPQSPYVFEYAAKWYELNTAGLSSSGRQSHRNAINNHICPVIGQLRLDEVKPDNIRAVMLAAANLSKAESAEDRHDAQNDVCGSRGERTDQPLSVPGA